MTSQGTTQATTTTRGPGAALRIVGIAFAIFGVVTLLVDATQVGTIGIGSPIALTIAAVLLGAGYFIGYRKR
jgi:hypothetical protein